LPQGAAAVVLLLCVISYGKGGNRGQARCACQHNNKQRHSVEKTTEGLAWYFMILVSSQGFNLPETATTKK
jgi:hypothetical protein